MNEHIIFILPKYNSSEDRGWKNRDHFKIFIAKWQRKWQKQITTVYRNGGWEISQEEMRILFGCLSKLLLGTGDWDTGEIQQLLVEEGGWSGDNSLGTGWQDDGWIFGDGWGSWGIKNSGKEIYLVKESQENSYVQQGENLSEERVLRRQLHQTCGRKLISQHRGRVTRKAGWSREEDKVKMSKRKELKTPPLQETVGFGKCGSTWHAKALFCNFKSALLNNRKIMESEVISSWK